MKGKTKYELMELLEEQKAKFNELLTRNSELAKSVVGIHVLCLRHNPDTILYTIIE